ncbi:fructosyl amino acid oxidase [Dendryphion nanum]|uniref:Fructosyl amino acid oxidase n=1 Tax=Dendryphion nanum TaxID=256645 RepID=A0A9P9DIP7_9PLEO|nr:fructosyl amino acid oxidase [Dendryphion nanum]
MEEPTILIVGAGTFGTSTAYHLAQRYKDPSRVTIIDRWAPDDNCEKHAAAIDVNRIIRTDYESPLYCNLANEAIHSWFWTLELGHFFHKTGWVVIDEDDSGYKANVKKTFQNRGSDYTTELPVQELAERWEVFRGLETKGHGTAYTNPEAGWCDAAKATANFMAAAEKRGVKRVTGEVAQLLFDSGRKRVLGVRTTDGHSFTADKIILATGAWTSSLCSPIEDALKITETDRIERQIQAVGRLSAYYTLSTDEADRLESTGLPILVYGQRGVLMPPSSQNRTLKVNDLKTEFVNTKTTGSGHKISVPSVRSQNDVPEKLKRETESLLTYLMPKFAQERKPDRWRICWDAKTPTDDWLMCKHPHPGLDNLYLAVGGSFHSYKFMPNAGNNGEEKDKAWKWKAGKELESTEGKELGSKAKNVRRPELRDFEEGARLSRL